MNLELQILSLIFSFSFGIVLSYLYNLFYNFLNYKIRRYICQRMANGIRRDLNFLFKSEVKVEKERNLWYPYSSGYVIHLRIFDVRKLWTIGDKTA